MVKEDLFYQLNITEDGYVLARCNNDVANSVSIIGYTDESKHARLFCAAPELLEALRQLLADSEFDQVALDAEYGCRKLDEIEKDGDLPVSIIAARAAIAKALGETK